MFLIFDTETTGLPQNYNAPVSDSDNWPRMVQLAWQLHDEKGELVEVKNFIVKPDGYTIPYTSEQIHGISTERAMQQGMDLKYVLEEFNKAVAKSQFSVGHNIEFDINIIGAEYFRMEMENVLLQKKSIDTKNEGTDFCKIPGGKGGKFKWPTLTELYLKLFNEGFEEAHNASADVEATTRAFLELVRLNVIKLPTYGLTDELQQAFIAHNPKPFQLIGLNIKPYNPNEIDGEIPTETAPEIDLTKQKKSKITTDAAFSHLHNHTQFSILQSTSTISGLVQKAVKEKMPGVALTDTANMMGAFHFVREVLGHNKGVEARRKEAEEKGEPFDEITLTPIVGCEFNVCKNHLDKSTKDNGFQVVAIAKNKNGYHNLAKMASIASVHGFYYVPRIDKDILAQYKEDVIVTTGGLYGEIASLILNVGETQAEESFQWYHNTFGEDFYVELLRHGQPEEDIANEVMIRFCKKYGVKYFAANNTFYLDQKDSKTHDILLCVKDAEKVSTPIGKGRGFRYGFPNNEYYFKSQEEMKRIFSDLPEAIETTQEIVDKVEPYELARDVLLPKFEIPQEFIDANEAEIQASHERIIANKEKEWDGKSPEEVEAKKQELRFVAEQYIYMVELTWKGAKERYPEITPSIKERLDFELETIEFMGFPGYFLIVADFISAARDMGVSVGPGRGSAAGSAIAYCLGITNVDPIKYDLLFERFLNPERVSMPDVDIDFDDRGRDKVLKYVIDKYGAPQVSQIITYGTMAAKSAIRDTARVLDLPLPDADRIAKLIPDVKLRLIFGDDDKKLKSKLKGAEEEEMVNQIRSLSEGKDLSAETIQQAVNLEGSMRNTGVHACGVIIAPEDISNLVPVANAKDSDMAVTQFDNSVVESAGLLKMDFLGLKNLTVIKDAVANIKARHGIEIIPDEIPLDDVKTYELFQRGETNGIFQFESPGMQKHLKALKPDRFDDLIAMNALYRPGPLEYIPNFIARKHGKEEIEYDVPEMEEYLKETYGITVYQEQVMLLSQSLAGFTKGEADTLRKAMGKKIFALLEKLKPKFIEGGAKNGHPEDKLEKIWKDWEAFAAYAFNKSHSTCYAYIAFHTAYLKANYPAEYMAAVLSNNMNQIKTVTFFMEECKRMGIPVLGPDVNESQYWFSVNPKGEIRFGLGATKGVGEGAVNALVREREENGLYQSVFDLSKRLDGKTMNKKTMESLVFAGALDSFQGLHRGMFLQALPDGQTFLEKVLKFGQSYQESLDAPPDLFGDVAEVEIQEPAIPDVPEWNRLQLLAKEREMVGIFISGHPLDDYKTEINHFCNCSTMQLSNVDALANREITFAGAISNVQERIDKNGNPFGIFNVEDFVGSHEFMLFKENYVKFKGFLVNGAFVFIKAKVEPRWRGADRMEIKFQQMHLLSDVMENLVKKMVLTYPLSKIDESCIARTQAFLEENPGSVPVKIKVLDFEEKLDVELPSKTHRIKANNAFVRNALQLMTEEDWVQPGFEPTTRYENSSGKFVIGLKPEEIEETNPILAAEPETPIEEEHEIV